MYCPFSSRFFLKDESLVHRFPDDGALPAKISNKHAQNSFWTFLLQNSSFQCVHLYASFHILYESDSRPIQRAQSTKCWRKWTKIHRIYSQAQSFHWKTLFPFLISVEYACALHMFKINTESKVQFFTLKHTTRGMKPNPDQTIHEDYSWHFWMLPLMPLLLRLCMVLLLPLLLLL